VVCVCVFRTTSNRPGGVCYVNNSPIVTISKNALFWRLLIYVLSFLSPLSWQQAPPSHYHAISGSYQVNYFRMSTDMLSDVVKSKNTINSCCYVFFVCDYVIFTFRVNRGDLLSAVSYALRREVAIHSIVSGSAYSALYRFIHLLESVSSRK
jgi:hypothetical protein